MKRTIRIKGESNLKIVPDTVVFTLDLNLTDLNYQKALSTHQNNHHEIIEALLARGFKKEEILTSNLDISMQYEYQEERGVSKKKLVGYRISQELKISFPLDNDRINLVITKLAETSVNPELRISFTVSNQEKYTANLLKAATKDALEKAHLLAESTGVKLGELLEIDYSWDEIRFESASRYNVARANLMSLDMSFQPEAIEIKDSVNFLWEII